MLLLGRLREYLSARINLLRILNDGRQYEEDDGILYEEALDRTFCRTRCGRDSGPVGKTLRTGARQKTSVLFSCLE
jgi:hypothetical protein